MTDPHFLDLDGIEELCAAATPGPWFVRNLDDDHSMNLVAISTVEDTGRAERRPEFDHGEIVAATLVQQPRYVDCADGRWDENAAFIAMAREAVPRLVAEVRRLRWLLDYGACGTAGTTGTEFVIPLDEEMLAYFRAMVDVLVRRCGISRAEAVARINATYGAGQSADMEVQLMGHELPEFWAYGAYYRQDDQGRLPKGNPSTDADIDFSRLPIRPAPPKDSPFWTVED
ncbi:hypothetical protein [Streptomyces sp. S.PNR 29]|uniref:hypothetical protein n=1 Tax=Streptomyces sp. S.PNR 29 TaxID=2973805 RepID=UPI0025B19BD6|nr:hypothetical protein [Streptomyces sp. S.PNR 29]MDN0193718.1 hypothetical protein [Streptomyces sp. S.PNR 29]